LHGRDQAGVRENGWIIWRAFGAVKLAQVKFAGEQEVGATERLEGFGEKIKGATTR